MRKEGVHINTGRRLNAEAFSGVLSPVGWRWWALGFPELLERRPHVEEGPGSERFWRRSHYCSEFAAPNAGREKSSSERPGVL